MAAFNSQLDFRKNNIAEVSHKPSLNTQSCIRRPLCSTLKFKNLSTYQPILRQNKIEKRVFGHTVLSDQSLVELLWEIDILGPVDINSGPKRMMLTTALVSASKVLQRQMYAFVVVHMYISAKSENKSFLVSPTVYVKTR